MEILLALLAVTKDFKLARIVGELMNEIPDDPSSATCPYWVGESKDPNLHARQPGKRLGEQFCREL